MLGQLVPARFLTLTGHLCIAITLLWESQQSAKRCLPDVFHPTHLKSYQRQLISGLSTSIAFICFELITFLSGYTIFVPTNALVSTGCHGMACIVLSYFILDSWQCDWFWTVFVFCSIIPFVFDFATVLAIFTYRSSITESQSAPRGEWTSVLIFAGIVTTFGSALPVGYNIGVVNTPADIIKQFCNESFTTRYNVELSPASLSILWSSVVSIFIVGGVTGSCLGASVADNIGRKGGAVVVNALSFAAAILFICSKPANSVEMLLLGRLLVGLSGGLTTSVLPMYLTEMAPLKLRGAMGVLVPLGVTFGVLVGQVMGLDVILGQPEDWHYLLGVYGILVAFFTPFLFMLPESPKYLFVVKSDRERAIQALSRIRNKPPPQLTAEIADLDYEVGAAMETGIGEQWGLLQVIKSPALRLSLLLVCLMQAGQQTSGINAVFYYSASIFKKAKLSTWEAQLATIGAGLINCAMAIVAIPLMSRCGRRPLALFSTASATICLLVLCVTIQTIDSTPWMPILCITAVSLYVFFYGIGLGPIPYFVGSELFEVGPRPAAMALGSLSNWAGNFLVGMTFPLLQASIGPYSFILFAASTAALHFFIRFYLPETKGKSPTEVALLCRNGFSLRPV